MSYVHYWEWDHPIANNRLFSAWSADVFLLIQHLPPYGYNGKDPLTSRGFDGMSEPVCTETEVAFNGDDTHGQDFGHEGFRITFHELEQQHFFNGCKTAAKPYDLLVTAALLRFVYYFEDARIMSDGNVHAWQPAFKLCADVFGKDGGTIPSTIEGAGNFLN